MLNFRLRTEIIEQIVDPFVTVPEIRHVDFQRIVVVAESLLAAAQHTARRHQRRKKNDNQFFHIFTPYDKICLCDQAFMPPTFILLIMMSEQNAKMVSVGISEMSSPAKYTG